MEGTRSWVTSTVPRGTRDTSTSRTPSSWQSTPLLMSRTSAARWRVRSSSAASNMTAKVSHTVSRAASAHWPPSMRLSISATMNGSEIMSTWPSRMAASASPTRSRTTSAFSRVSAEKASMAPCNRLFSASASVTSTTS